MPRKKKEPELLSIADVAEKAEWEGLPEMIFSYMDGTNIADPVLREKWQQAHKLMNEIADILEPHMGLSEDLDLE